MLFDIPVINRDRVLKGLCCDEDSPVYESVVREYDNIIKKAEKVIAPQAWVEFEGELCYAVMSVGAGISELSSELFSEGEGVAGLLANAIGDEYLFALDDAVGEYIRTECAKRSVGVLKRRDNENLAALIKKSGCTGVVLTQAGMFSPVKSMGYALELTNSEQIFNVQHDCSKCQSKNCPRRTAPYRPEQLSILDIYAAKFKSGANAVCIDIGTTTIVFASIKNGKTERVISCPNPQRRFGADVISRIEAAMRGRFAEMKQAVCVSLIKGVKALADATTERIVISANTVMTYIMMGFDTAPLGAYPFKTEHKEIIKTSFSDITGSGINIETIVMPPVSAFIGGDIVSGIYMTKMYEDSQPALLLDLGTNGEMVIGGKDGMLAASAAAGPAFEGGAISCGCPSVEGAICAVDDAGKVRTIGQKKAVGICGSGIVELIAYMIDNKIIDSTGRMNGEYRKNGYCVCDNIYFTQEDVRAVQMAKAAISAGVQTLMKRSGVTTFSKVYLAGGFGCFISPSAAAKIGLMPQGAAKCARPVGNSSLGGAVKLAATSDVAAIREICAKTHELVLGKDEFFSKNYIGNMNF